MTANASGLYETRFWIVRRNVEGVLQWYGRNGAWGNRMHAKPYEIMSEARARAKTERGASVCSVRCIALNLQTKMRERSSAWVLRRLAEGKVVIQSVHNGAIFFQRFNAKHGFIEHAIHNTSCWKLDNTGFAVNGRVLCRVARSEEVEK